MSQIVSLARGSGLARRALRALGLGDPHQDLPLILAGAEGAQDSAARVFALGQLVAWVRGSSYSPIGRGTAAALVRFRFLLQLLERHDGPRRAVAQLIGTILRETEAPSLFAQTDLNEQGSLFSEVFRRLGDQILPPPPRPHELAYAVRVAFVHATDRQWLEAVPDEEWLRFVALLQKDGGPGLFDRTAIEADLRDSIVNLSLHAAALGLSEEVRERVRLEKQGSDGSPFVALSRLTLRWRDSGSTDDTRLFLQAVVEGHQAVHEAYKAVEAKGVSLALVYRLETVTGLLRRMELILRLLDPQIDDRDRCLRARDLIVEVVRARMARRSVRALLNMNFDIFASRLVQHAGETGEHYIARTRAEYTEMFRSAAGGGLVTVLTTLLKFVIFALGLPLFFEGFFVWVNYSGSFLAMQFLGFSLATKQPSMTSAALADKLSRTMSRTELGTFVEEIASIARSQFIAAVGNVGLVIPGALAAEYIFERCVHHTVISQAYAAHVLESFHPWKSLSLPYAALTGVLLWLSSFGAGFLQNWVIYRGLPEAIGEIRALRAIFGEQRTRALGRWVGHNASGIGGNIAIGFLLAFVPVAGRFFGLPLDIRHVTLSAGSMTFAFCSLVGALLNWQIVAESLLGIVGIGFLNFGVSFACALAVAARARKVRRAWFRAVLTFAWVSFLRAPWHFFWPPVDSPVATDLKPHS